MKRNIVDDICSEVEMDSQPYNAMAPEIVQTSSFYFESYDEYIAASQKGSNAFVYTRGSNPTTEKLESKLARLENAEKCKVFGSGMGAISATLISLLEKGDHVTIVNTVYGTALSLIKYLSKYGVSADVINSTDISEITSCIRSNTRIVYFESPSSQKFEMIDLEEISKVARDRGIITVIDNTWASPLNQNPLDHGIDVVIHSCSKYIGGHSDLVAGAVMSSKEIINEIEDTTFSFLGSTVSPFNSFLGIRGLRTLPVRMRSIDSSIKEVINFLMNDTRIESIYHPLAGDSNQRELGEKYLKGYGSLFSIVLADPDLDKLKTFVDSLSIFTLGVSWGGYESLILPLYKGNNEENIKDRGLKNTHIRLYVGLEDPLTLINDLSNALNIAYGIK